MNEIHGGGYMGLIDKTTTSDIMSSLAKFNVESIEKSKKIQVQQVCRIFVNTVSYC